MKGFLDKQLPKAISVISVNRTIDGRRHLSTF